MLISTPNYKVLSLTQIIGQRRWEPRGVHFDSGRGADPIGETLPDERLVTYALHT
jgi:hypothetical protein